MVRLLGRISDKRIFFEDSYTIIDHGSTVSLGAGGSQYVATHLKSVIWGWTQCRGPGPTTTWVIATGGACLAIKEGATLAAAMTVDWFAFGYTA